MKKNKFFFNGCFDKNRIKLLISWSLQNCGEQITIDLVENLKNIGFNYATQAGVSLGIDDLKIPPTKAQFILDSDIDISSAQIHYKQGYITGIEKFQQLIDTWHRISDTLKQNVIQYFKVTNVFNPVYMMAFSGARGNISQVRQLVGMRGLMSDPQGQILDFPIKSNFREGLTLTEYVISCYGARKGLVDTALKTANSGYLTRRLVDVSHHIIVCEFDCKTKKGVILNTIIENQKIIVPLQNRLVGRILAENIYLNFSGFLTKKDKVNIYIGNTTLKNKTSFARHVALFSKILIVQFFNAPENWIQKKAAKFHHNFSLCQLLLFLKHVNIYYTKQKLVATKNQEVSLNLAIKIASLRKQVLVRSPLTCEIKNSICQLCYGWSLAHGKLVSLGEAVGILAAQSIGEPGTQLTMRTFHTGGVFSGDMMSEIRAPFDGIIQFSESFQGMLIRTPHGKIAFLTKIPGKFEFYASYDSNSTSNEKLEKIHFQIPAFTILFIRNHEYVPKTQIIAEFSSISFDQEQRIQANHDLNTEIEGEVFFKNVVIHIRKKKNKLISRTTANLGSIWIVSGKIYTQPIPIVLFPQSGDLVDQISIIGQYKTISPYNGFLTSSPKNSPILSTNTHVLSFNYQTSKIVNKLPIQINFSNKASLKLAKENTNFFRFANKTLFDKQSKLAKKTISRKHNSKKMKLNNNTILLHHPLISFPMQYIQYKKIGYFFSFYPFKKTQFSLDNFFLSNSLHQKFYNSNKLQTTFYFQSFPKQYQTQTGGILVYDNFYLNEKFHCGEIFWIDEERYIFNFNNSVYFKNTCDKDTKIINSTLSFSKNKKKYFKKPGISLFQSKPILKKSFRSWNSVPIYSWIKKKKIFRKWVSRTNPLIFNYNNQGKISNIYSKLYGFLETSGIDLFLFTIIFATVSTDSLAVQEKDKYKPSKKTLKQSKRKSSQNISLVQLGSNHQNDWKPFFYRNKYEFETIGVKKNPIVFIFQLCGLNLPKIQSKFLIKVDFSTFTKKNLNTPTFFCKPNQFNYHILQYLKKNKTVHEKVLKKNSLPFLQPKFPWVEFDQYNFFESSINTSFSNHMKPSVFSIFSSSFSTLGLQGKKQIQDRSKNKYKSIVKFYHLSKKKIKQKSKALNKVSFALNKTKLGALHKKKELIKVRIKPGWIYFPKNIRKAIQKHKWILKPGEQWCDGILFDQYGVYIECLALKKNFANNKKKIQIGSPIDLFLFKQNLDATNIKKKNSDLINLLGMLHIYTEFNIHSNYKNPSLYSRKLKQNFSNFITNYKLSINFLEILETILKNSYSTGFFNNNFSISPFLFSSIKQNSIFNTRYTLFLLEKNIKKNKLQFLYLLHKEFQQNSTIQNKVSLEVDLSPNLLKIYNYKKIYFLENYIFLKNAQQITNSVPLYTNLKKKNFFSLFEPSSKIESKPSIQVDLSPNLSKKKYCNMGNISHIFFFRSTNTFLPESFILIRKIVSYPFISSIYYKKLLAQQNKTSFYSLKNQNTSISGVPNSTQSLSFNKQNNTQLFSNTPPADFVIKPYLKYRNCKKNISSKKNTLLEFYIIFIIPLNYSINAAKIQLMFKSAINDLNLKTINFFSLFCNIQKNSNRVLNLNIGSQFSLIRQPTYHLDFLVKQRNKLNFACIVYLNVSTFRELQFSNNAHGFSVNTSIPSTRTKLVSYFQNFISTNTPVSLTKFFSPYQGEILETKIESDEKKKYLVLTDTDQTSFFIPNSFRNEMVLCKTLLGKFLNYGTKIHLNCAIPESGLIIQIEKSKITVRKAQPILFSSKGLLSVHHGDLVEKNALILRLFYQRLKTGDIVQGIPKIEQLFEARKTNQGELLIGSLHEELEWLFLFYKKKYDFQKAARKSLQKIQQIIVNNVQKVYQSQGVTIAEKHLEIIVRQMTSKVQIITSGKTNLIPGELIDLDWIEIVNKGIKLKKKKAKYKPIILGITKKSLETKSFISEASFQETTRILAKSAIERKTDFLRGLKENVILGHLIPAGTGFAGKVFDSNKPKYFATNNYESYTIFRKIFLETSS